MCLSPVPTFLFISYHKITNTPNPKLTPFHPIHVTCLFAFTFFFNSFLQHAYAFFKKRRLQAQRQLKRDRGDPETSESESESESDSGSDNDTDRGSNSPSTAENSGQDDGSTPFHKKRKKKKT